MGKIILLDHDLVNKIAAGEVIERPASAVKELIENALDSGANSIIIEIGDGGKEYIKVKDNGGGMDEEDLRLSIKKHATSKIKTHEDLFRIVTLGFRGEALSSMAAVSKMEITTKTKEVLGAVFAKIENGEIKEIQETGAPEGTSIELYNLFYNVPARKNYLKDTQTELRYITSIVQKYALSNKDVSFKLIHNDQTIINAPSSHDPLAKIIALYGKDFARELIPVNLRFEDQNYPRTIQGYIGKPTINRSDKSYITTFVNNRYVKNNILIDSIFNAYDTMLNTQRYPVAIINFTLPIDKIDVNVHPSKTIIKLQNELEVADWITNELKKVLSETDLTPKPKLDKPPGKFTQETFNKIQPSKDSLPQTDINKLLEGMKAKEESKHKIRDNTYSKQQIIQPIEKNKNKEYSITEDNITEDNITEDINQQATSSEEDPIHIIGTIHKTYVLIETPNGLKIVDQHAAHERVQYEKFKQNLENRTLTKQNLLETLNLELSPEEKQSALEFKQQLGGIGFDFEDFGGNTILLRTLPSILGKQQGIDMFRQSLESFRREGISQDPITQIADNFMKTMGCRSAIKAGDIVEGLHINKILRELNKCNNKFTCPHGRPISIELTVKEFEKLFNRERGHETIA